MSLGLPADLERFTTDYDQLTSSAGVYLLELSKPANPTQAWDAEYDRRPSWFSEFRDASRVLYVGAASCVLSRLEDHRNSDVRKTALTRVCGVDELLDVWFYDDADEAFLRESQHALEVDQQTLDDVFVHQR